MSARLLLSVIMCSVAVCSPQPRTSSTTLRITAQRNHTGMWATKFGDYKMLIQHSHFENKPHQAEHGTWTLKVKHTTTVYNDDTDDMAEQMIMDILKHYNENSTASNENGQLDQLSTGDQTEQLDPLFPSTNSEETADELPNSQQKQLEQQSGNRQFDNNGNENGQSPELSSQSQDGDLDEQFLSLVAHYGQPDQLSSNNQREQIDQLSSDSQLVQIDNKTSEVEQMTNEEKEQYLAEEEKKFIMDRYPRSRSLQYDKREFQLESKGYRYFPEVGWVKLNTAHWQWDQAKTTCELDGGYLAIPDTLSKISAFKRLLKDNVDIIERAVLKNQVFVGVYVPYNNRRFITVKGEPFIPESVSIWFPNEPNNADPGEECVTMHLEGKLRDVPCFYNLPFLCQIL